MTRLFPIAVVSLLVLSSCSGRPDEGSSHLVGTDSFAHRLATADHRFLDTFTVDDADLGAIIEQHRALPYALGRAFEARGRRTAAERAYGYTVDAGVDLWAGFSAARLASIALRDGDSVAAHTWAVRGTEVQPENRDLWYYRGEALYEMEAYDTLLEDVATFPSVDSMTLGEAVGDETLRGEIALWNAVARFELDDAFRPAFVDAFVSISSDAIHTRLYLYLFYRDGALTRFAPEEQLLLEAVYRTARGEISEAGRLFRMIEPVAMTQFLRRAVDGGVPSEPLPGLFGTLDVIAAGDGPGTVRWITRLIEQTEDPPAADLIPRLNLILATARHRDDPAATRELLVELAAPENGYASAIRDRSRERVLDLAIDGGSDLAETIALLAELDAPPEEYERAVDRLLPPLVRTRAWGAIANVAEVLPDEAHGATDHVEYVLALADVEPEQRDLRLGRSAQRPALDFFGVAARSLLDREQELPDRDAVIAPTSGGSVVSLPFDELNRDDPRYVSLHHADALLTAGRVDEALSLAMAAARDPEVATPARQLARRFAATGHHAAALDLMRRAVVRGDLEIEARDLAILYPAAFTVEVTTAAGAFGVPPALLSGLVREESHFRPNAESHVGAQGLAQLMPATAEDIKRRLGRSDLDVGNPYDNLFLGAFYLDYLAEQLDEPVLRLAAYNAGLGRGRRWSAEFGDLPALLQIESIPFIETRWYVRRIAVSAAIYRWIADGTTVSEGFLRTVRGGI